MGGTNLYQLMIVDDELSIRHGIASSLPWEAWGFSVCAQCANGREAIEQLDQARPDVVLSDIRMPVMDGVELMQWLNANRPEIKIVILSGYNDFEYLNMSIKNQVTEYLLKPTDVDEFEQVFRRLREKMDAERRQAQANRESVQQHYRHWGAMLVQGVAPPQDTQRFLPVLHQRGVRPECCVLAIFEVDGRSGDDEAQMFRLRSEIVRRCGEAGEQLGGLAFSFFLASDGTLFALAGRPDGAAPTAAQQEAFAAAVQALVRGAFHATVSAGISDLCTGLEGLPTAYQQAHTCVGQRVFSGPENVSRFSAISAQRPRHWDYFDEDAVERALLAGDYDAMAAELHRVFAAVAGDAQQDAAGVDRLCMALLLNLSMRLQKYGVDLEEVARSLGAQYQDLYRCDSLDRKEQFLVGLLYGAQRKLSARRDPGPAGGIVAMARDLVDREYASNAVSLEYVADKVQRSPAYVSKMFKSVLGWNFSDYLTAKRLQHAQELLADETVKIYELARLCGYADTSHFIRSFKKKYGVSPSEYRRQLGRGL